MESCERCSRRVVTHWSDAAGARVCERCHFAASPPPDARTRAAVLAYQSPSPPPRRKPTAKIRMVERVWSALERVGTVSALCDGSGVLVGYCPACERGTVSLRVWGDIHEPRLRVQPCSAGCDEDAVMQAVR
jgi:hypothetical protein